MHLATISLILSTTFFAAAAGIVVRDIGSARQFGLSGTISPLDSIISLLNAYELPHELGVSSTVRLLVAVDAPFSDWRIEYESNGSSLTPFRPPSPGAIRITLQNLENRTGQVGMTVLQRNKIPPDLETSLLDPLLFGTLALLAASVVLYAAGRRGGRDR